MPTPISMPDHIRRLRLLSLSSPPGICRSAARNAQSEATFVLPLAKMEPSLSGSDEISQPPHQPTNKTEIRQEFVDFEFVVKFW